MTPREEAGNCGSSRPDPEASVSFDSGRRRFLGVGIALLVGFCLGDPIAAAAEDRSYLARGMAAAGGALPAPQLPATGGAPVAPVPCAPRSLSFFNTHTSESLQTVYWCDGDYRPEALGAIDHILRDHRTDEVKDIDPTLLDTLHSLRTAIGSDAPFHVISGYRSPTTNAYLRQHERGVAAGSLHMVGRAIDIRLPGTRLQDLHNTALAMKAGGVGYYPASDFVHVDTGRVREW